MKRFKFAAVAALFAVAAAPAFATLVGSTSEDAAEMFLNVWSPTAQANYVLDLGITLGAFQTNGNAAAGYSFSAAVDALYSSSALAQASDKKWAVAVFDTKGDLTPGSLRLFTTLDNSFNPLADPSNSGFTGDRLQNSEASWFSWVAFTGGRGTHPTVPNGSSLVTAADPQAYFLANGNPAGTFNNNAVGFNQGNAVGAASKMYYYTSADPDFGDTQAAVSTFGNAAHTGSWVFDGTNVSYTLAAAVPEPGSYAMLLAGLGALGIVIRRRLPR